MAAPGRLVLFVEGDGDKGAMVVLVKKLLADAGAFPDVILDPAPFVVGNVADLTARKDQDWLRFLGAIRSRSKLGAVLLVLDGDLKSIRGAAFCPTRFARRLAERARDAGAGKLFSVGVVFARQEFESWILAGAEQLAGVLLPDGRPGIQAGIQTPTGNLEEAPRNAKKWLDEHIDAGYKPTRDQELLTQLLVDHLEAVRQRNMRSFRRLEAALFRLVEAIRTGNPVVSPDSEPPTPVSGD